MTRVLVTGATGFLGPKVVELLQQKGYTVSAVGKDYCDFLGNMDNIESMIQHERPDSIIHLAAIVGGILKNRNQPYHMLVDNLRMNSNFLEAARRCGIKRLVYTFCGCAYGKDAPNPIKEDYLFNGVPDVNAKYYALGKAVNSLQVEACRKEYGYDWVSCIPGNAYGPNDNFSENDSHVIAGLIRRFHQAKEAEADEISVWGDGSPIRDFIYVDDVAEGIVRTLQRYHTMEPINISSGIGVSIKETTEIIKRVVGYNGNIHWDTRMPSGHAEKVFDVQRMKSMLDFEPKVKLEEGIKRTYDWYQKALAEGKVRL